jgi:hypothetical protein
MTTNLRLSEFVTLLNGSRFGPHRAPYLLEVYKAFIDMWESLAMSDVLGEQGERYAMHQIRNVTLMCIAMRIITQDEFEEQKALPYYDQAARLREKILTDLKEVQS